MTTLTRLPRVRLAPVEAEPDPRTKIRSYMLSLLAVILLALLVNVTLISQLQHYSAQNSLYDELRLTLAEGSAPIGQLDINGELVEPGTPVALLEIPRLDVREVVVEGTASRQTQQGVGHRRDTPLPGQPGVSVLMGRAAGYGGVFGNLDTLAAGDTFTVTTGQGVSTYEVYGVRTTTTMLPVLEAGQGRLTLTTAAGRPFMPEGVLRVDAALVSEAYPRPPVAIAPGNIEDSEEALASDPSGLFALSWILEALVATSVLAVWAWKRWNHRGTWIAFTPLLAALSLASASRICDLLPNLV
jgi:sortase A